MSTAVDDSGAVADATEIQGTEQAPDGETGIAVESPEGDRVDEEAISKAATVSKQLFPL